MSCVFGPPFFASSAMRMSVRLRPLSLSAPSSIVPVALTASSASTGIGVLLKSPPPSFVSAAFSSVGGAR